MKICAKSYIILGLFMTLQVSYRELKTNNKVVDEISVSREIFNQIQKDGELNDWTRYLI